MKLRKSSLAAAALLSLCALSSQAQTLRIGLAEDPDALDPTTARTFVGRIVFSAMCDKLLEVDEKMNFVPQLATSYEWSADGKALTMKLRSGVTFHDGEKLDAEAVKFSIERHKTLQGSNRRGELRPVTSVDVLDDSTVRINLDAPFVPLLAALADRAGMILSPKAAKNTTNFAAAPVCAGPFKFVERVAQDRIVLQKYDGYWNKDAIHFDKVVYTPVPDATVRLANLRAGQFDFIERVSSSDIGKLAKEPKFKTSNFVEIGYQSLIINTGKSDRAQATALKDPRVRKALELSLDRQGLVQVVMDSAGMPGNQWVSPKSNFYVKSNPVPQRDVAKAKALLKEAGVTNPSFTLLTATTTDAQKIAQVVQAMAKESGFDIKIQSNEFATTLGMSDKGDFEAYLLSWSGRADPDGSVYSFLGCKQPQNYSGYCKPEVDEALNAARTTSDMAERMKHYEVVNNHLKVDSPLLYLYHRNWLWGYNAKLSGVREIPDGLLRVQGLKMN